MAGAELFAALEMVHETKLNHKGIKGSAKPGALMKTRVSESFVSTLTTVSHV